MGHYEHSMTSRAIALTDYMLPTFVQGQVKAVITKWQAGHVCTHQMVAGLCGCSSCSVHVLLLVPESFVDKVQQHQPHGHSAVG